MEMHDLMAVFALTLISPCWITIFTIYHCVQCYIKRRLTFSVTMEAIAALSLETVV